MRKVQKDFKGLKIVVRCENLPVIKGNREDVAQLFEGLIRIILSYSDTTAQVFLYIDCEDMERGRSAHVTSEEYKIYAIKFRTNISPDSNWMQVHADALARYKQLLSIHNAIFHVNSTNAGCMFSISVPGKF